MPVIEADTYLYLHRAEDTQELPSQTSGCLTTMRSSRSSLGDFRRLWATNFLDDLSIEVRDVPLANGVIGKLVIYNMEERQRVKIVDYVGTEEGRPVQDRRGAEGEAGSRSGSTRSSIRD